MFRKSILAGVCIAIGALIYIKFPTPVGAAFFSAGLLLIMTLDYRLYTGVIGLAQTP
jgi:formate/nitrite transporter FocA (FNT family)